MRSVFGYFSRFVDKTDWFWIAANRFYPLVIIGLIMYNIPKAAGVKTFAEMRALPVTNGTLFSCMAIITLYMLFLDNCRKN